MRRKEQAAASRAALVEAAAACFAEEGYEATTVAAILDRVGMARGALYHYFPGGKRELFFAVFESVNEAFHARRDAVATIESPLGRIRAGARVFLELSTEDRFARILLVDAPEIVPGQAERGSTFALLHEQLVEAKAAGEIATSTPRSLPSPSSVRSGVRGRRRWPRRTGPRPSSPPPGSWTSSSTAWPRVADPPAGRQPVESTSRATNIDLAFSAISRSDWASSVNQSASSSSPDSRLSSAKHW